MIMMTVFGIDDFSQDKLYSSFHPELSWSSESWYESWSEMEMVNPPDFIKYDYNRPSKFGQVIHYESSVVGLITSKIYDHDCIRKIYDHDCIRALSMIYPEFREAGYKIIEPVSPYNPDFNIILPIHFYDQGFCYDVPEWIKAVSYCFDHIGIMAGASELKWMLYWQWN